MKKIKLKFLKFNSQRLIYVSLFILLITNFLLLIGLNIVGKQIAITQGGLAQSQIRITKILGIIAERQINPLFQVEKENFKKQMNHKESLIK